MRKLILYTIALIAGLCGCNENGNSTFMDSREVLRVYNFTEYMDFTTISDFEKEFNIRVIYDEYVTNEEMYDNLLKKPTAFDVLVPSDYMVDCLIKEGKLAKIDPEKISNISRIDPKYLKPDYDSNNEYSVPYMAGTFGILYNKKRVSNPVDSWTSLWDTKYKGEIIIWDSQQDVIGVVLKMLGYSLNSNNDAELAKAKSSLISGRSLFQYSGLADEIRDKMIANEGILALVFSGDAKTAVDQNPNLAYVIPKEGSNKWVDSFVIMKNTENMEAAVKFINFMCRPNIAVRNMTKFGYTSPVSGAWSEFGDNRIMFPTDEELDRCEPILYNKEAAQKYARLWMEVR